MNTLPFYKRIVGVGMIAVLVCSVFSIDVALTHAQTGGLQPGNSDATAPNYDDIVNQRIESIANPSYDDIVSDRITQTQSINSQSANTGSQNNPKQDGGSGNKETEWDWKMLSPYYFIPAALRILGNTILMMFGWALGLVGLIFNFIIDKTIVNLKSTIDSLGIITDIWKVIRDFINLFFIFALLYAAVGTILGLEKVNWKSTVSNLILAALLINFSLFITKAALDLSNIVTIGFYTQLPGVGAVGSGSINPALNQSNAGGISNSIMQSLKLETIYKPKYTGTGMIAAADEALNAPANAFAYILATVMGSIFICVTMVVMVAACWLFLKRFIDIIFLMIRSPIAFAGYVLPQLSEYQNNWWTELKANVVFPPVYMAMMWITFKILQSPGFQTIAPGSNGFGEAFTSLGPTTINIVFRFVVVIAMMVYALKSASKVGVEGGEMFTDFLKEKKGQLQGAVTGAIGRNTLGRGAAMLQDKNSVAGQALRRLETIPLIGATTSKAIRGGLKDVSGNSFGGAKGGFDNAVKEEAKYAKEGYARVGEKREWTRAAPVKPVEPKLPESIPGETPQEWLKREQAYVEEHAKYTEDLKVYERENPEYVRSKEAFDEAEKKAAEERQAKFRSNYEKTSLLREDRATSSPILAENRAALEAINKKKEEDEKKEGKKTEQTTEWEKNVLALLENLGKEATSSLNETESVVGVREDESTPEMLAARRKVSVEFAIDKASITSIADKKEKLKKLEEVRKKYKEIEEAIADEEIATLTKIEIELRDAVGKRKHELTTQLLRIKKSQRARNELRKKLEKYEEKRDREEEKERERKEREDKEKKESGGGGGGESKKTK